MYRQVLQTGVADKLEVLDAGRRAAVQRLGVFPAGSDSDVLT